MSCLMSLPRHLTWITILRSLELEGKNKNKKQTCLFSWLPSDWVGKVLSSSCVSQKIHRTDDTKLYHICLLWRVLKASPSCSVLVICIPRRPRHFQKCQWLDTMPRGSTSCLNSLWGKAHLYRIPVNHSVRLFPRSAFQCAVTTTGVPHCTPRTTSTLQWLEWLLLSMTGSSPHLYFHLPESRVEMEQ